MERISRRSFLKLAGASAAAGVAPACDRTTKEPAPAAVRTQYTFLNQDEAAFLEAAVFCERYGCEHFAKSSPQTVLLPVLFPGERHPHGGVCDGPGAGDRESDGRQAAQAPTASCGATTGDNEKRLPICANCHGPGGVGQPPL